MTVQQTPHSTENYQIGKGILHVAEWSGATPPADPGDYDDMGNCPSVELEPSTERLLHYSSRTDFRLKDKNPVIQRDYVVNFSCDEFAAVNLNRYLMGNLSGTVISAMQSVNKEYALKFVSDNPIGPNETWKFWKCTIAPSGALQLIGEEWMIMEFVAEGLADLENHATSPYFDVSCSRFGQ